MKIAIGCDPNAQEVKMELIKFIEDKGLGEVTDFWSVRNPPANPQEYGYLKLRSFRTEGRKFPRSQVPEWSGSTLPVFLQRNK